MLRGDRLQLSKKETSGLVRERRQAFDDAVTLGHVKNARMPLGIVTQMLAGFPKCWAGSEVHHACSIPQLLVLENGNMTLITGFLGRYCRFYASRKLIRSATK